MFEKITPEMAGISSAKVARLIEKLNQRSLPMHSVLMMKGDKLFCEYYWSPFNKDTCHRMYSQTKSYTSVAIGLLEEEGKLDLDAKICDLFRDKIDTPPCEEFREQTVREMLTMTTASDPARWFDTDYDDRTRMYMNVNRSSCKHIPGTVWEYDSAGSQVLSSLVERLSGMSTFDYLNEKIFKHLGTFKTARMLKTRNGDSWGDSALYCTPRDMVSFARFVMNYGTFEGKRLMNEKYLKLATSKVVDNIEFEHPVFRHGYGYQIWRTEGEGFAFNGMGAQYTICLPEKDLIFCCNADTQGMAMDSDVILGYFFDLIVDELSPIPLPEDKAAQEKLEAITRDLKLYSLTGKKDSPMRAEINGAKYICRHNPMGWREFSFSFDKDGMSGTLRYVNGQGEKELPFGICHNAFGKFPQLGYSDEYGGVRTTDGSMYDAAVSAAWLQNNKLGIKVQIIDKYLGNALFIFGFKGDLVTVRMSKTAEDFLDEYQGDLIGRRATV